MATGGTSSGVESTADTGHSSGVESTGTTGQTLPGHSDEPLPLSTDLQEALHVISTVALPARVRNVAASRPRIVIDSGANNCLFATRDYEIQGTFKPTSTKVDGIGGVTCEIIGYADQAIPV